MADDAQDTPPEEGSSSCCGSCSCSCGRMFDSCLSPDIFGKRPELRLPNGRKKYSTFFGCCFTLIYVAALGAFIFLTTMQLLDIDANNKTQITKRTRLDMETAQPPAVPIAFAVINPNDGTVAPLDPQIATIKAYTRDWNFDESDERKQEAQYKIVPDVDACSDDQLAKFFAVAEGYEQKSLDQFKGHMKCVNRIKSGLSRQALAGFEMVLMVEPCTGGDCVADYNSAKNLLEGQHIVMMYNEVVVDPTSFEEAYEERARIIHVPIQTMVAIESVYTLNVGKLFKREDFLMPFYDRAEEDIDLYKLKKSQDKVVQMLGKQVIAAVTIQKSHEFKEVTYRALNSLWVHLAVLGGFAIVLYFILAMVVSCLVDKKFENYLVSELYTATETEEAAVEAEGDDDEAQSSGCCSCSKESISRLRYHTASAFHNEIFGKDDKILNRSKVGCSYRICRYLKCCCGQRRRIERIFMKGRRITAQELNITSLIKAQRQSEALSQIMSKDAKAIQRSVKRNVVLSDEEDQPAQVYAGQGDEEDPKRAGDTTGKPDQSNSVVENSPRDKLMGQTKERSDSYHKKQRRGGGEEADEDDKGRRGGRSKGRRDDDRKRRDGGDRGGDRGDRRQKDREGGGDDDGDRQKRRERRRNEDSDGGDGNRDRERRDKSRGRSKKRD